MIPLRSMHSLALRLPTTLLVGGAVVRVASISLSGPSAATLRKSENLVGTAEDFQNASTPSGELRPSSVDEHIKLFTIGLLDIAPPESSRAMQALPTEVFPRRTHWNSGRRRDVRFPKWTWFSLVGRLAEGKRSLKSQQNPKDNSTDANGIEEVVEDINEYGEYERRKWMHIFQSNDVFDWVAFGVFVVFFLSVYHKFFIGLPTSSKYRGCAIFGWIMIATSYALLLYAKQGVDASITWMNGYLLELVFSLENIFVFHVIIESFGTPTICVQKVLFLIVCCQIIFELVLYMGVADIIGSITTLPYILGAWLSYLGLHSAFTSNDHTDINILEFWSVKSIRASLGNMLLLQYDANGSLLTYDSNNGLQLTLLALVFMCLLAADFFLEIDVTLTKIEQSRDEYLSFTSSALAGFAVPELFFVARDLFVRFALLKYGISFVLVFYGVQLISNGLMELSPLQDCGVILIVMLLCILLSAAFGIEGSDRMSNSRDSGDSSTADPPVSAKRVPKAEEKCHLCCPSFSASTNRMCMTSDPSAHERPAV